MSLVDTVHTVLNTATDQARQESDRALLDAERMADEFADVRPSRFVFPHNAMLGFPVVNEAPERETEQPPKKTDVF